MAKKITKGKKHRTSRKAAPASKRKKSRRLAKPKQAKRGKRTKQKRKTAKKKSAGRKRSAGRGTSSAKSASKARRLKRMVDPAVAAAMKQYEEAVLLFNRQSYRRAMALFEKVAAGPSRGLAERARVHIAMCDHRMQSETHVRFRSVDDHYDYAVSQINLGNLAEAQVHLRKAVKAAPQADHVHYALATVAALSNEPDLAIEHLEQAIGLRAENRFQARNDEDFESLQSDLTFQQLVFPERFPTAQLR